MNPQNPNCLFDPTINAATAPTDSFKSDPAARTGIHSPIPDIQHAYHTAASRETSKAWVAAAAPYRKVDDDDMWRRIHRDVWSVVPIPQPVGLTEEEKKVFDQLCSTEIRKLRVD